MESTMRDKLEERLVLVTEQNIELYQPVFKIGEKVGVFFVMEIVLEEGKPEIYFTQMPYKESEIDFIIENYDIDEEFKTEHLHLKIKNPAKVEEGESN